MTKQDAAAPLQQFQTETEALRAETASTRWQVAAGVAVLAVALWIGLATWRIPAMPGTDGTGAGLVPGLCAFALAIGGMWLIWEARTGGWCQVVTASRAVRAQITPWVWISAGLLQDSAMGFLLSLLVLALFMRVLGIALPALTAAG